jgi:hypothetical protein
VGSDLAIAHCAEPGLGRNSECKIRPHGFRCAPRSRSAASGRPGNHESRRQDPDRAARVSELEGLIGGPLIIVSGTAVVFSGNDPNNALHSLQGIATIPEFLWELSLGLYCTFKGFRPSSPTLRADGGEGRVGALTPAALPA